jgi:large repetitive protein
VRFREPGSGVVYGYPVNGDTGPGSSGTGCNNQPGANGGASSCVGTGASPALTVVLAPGQELPQQSLPVDPSGVVYDSGSRQPVPGSVVTFAPVGVCAGYDPNTAIVGATLGGYTVNGNATSMTVGADGFYQYLLSPGAPASCTFALTVTPPTGYTFQSAAIPPTAGPLTPQGGPGSVFPVQPQAAAPSGAVGTATTYYLTLTSGSQGANIIHNHIPLDPALPGAIGLTKTGDKALAEIGDSVRYTITVSVLSGALPRQTTVVDRLPAGFTYIPGTAMVGEQRIADPQGGVGPRLAFNLGPMAPANTLVLRYRVRVGVGAQQGDGINSARAHACSAPAGCVDASFNPLAGSVATNEARHRVRVSGGVFGTEACVLGKIYVDCNNNQVQDREELGVPGVRLVMQDGTTLISDSEGKYSICGLSPRSGVLRVDPSTLPRGSRLVTTSSRNLGDAGSLWLDLKSGELHRADFAEGSCNNTVLEQVKARRAQGEVRAPENEREGRPALRFDSKAHGLDTLSSPQQGTDGANQLAPKAREPKKEPDGPARDESNKPTPALPQNRPPPRGRDSSQAPSGGSQ